MAKILTTAIVAQIRNKLNGTVFSSNHYGPYVRTKVTPFDPRTPAQLSARNIFGTLSAMWKTLTEAQRQTWILAAPSFPITDYFGNSKVLTGNSFFISCNSYRLLLGYSAKATAPLPVPFPNFKINGAQILSFPCYVRIYSTLTYLDPSYTLYYQATRGLSPGINTFKNAYRNIGGISTSPTGILSDCYNYASVLGPPVVSTKISIRIRIIHKLTGLSSPFYVAPPHIVAQ